MEAVKEVVETAAFGLGDLLDAGDGAVVTLVAGDTRLAAHRAVLAARSPVLGARFQHDTPQVAITDAEGPVLRQLLAYCYTLQAPQLPSMAPQLLAAADKYGLSGLKDACEQQLAAQLHVENAAATAVLALSHSCSRLKEAAVAFIKTHTYEVVMTQGWADAVVSHPRAVVELTCLITEPSAPTRNLSGRERGRRLIQAAKQGTVEVLQALLEIGADVGARDENWSGWTALHWAAYWGDAEAVRCLVDGGAEVDARDHRKIAPLHLAAFNGHTAVVQMLLASSADPNSRHHWGGTPLHAAAYSGHADVVAVLLEAGTEMGARDNMGKTSLDYARLNKHQHLEEMLS
ncbi:poly [ADP-ribose] polymerase tankyrase-1-like isoform X5 [Schistocerca gregaria]|uniref:poly [ADP-ribose] polymerase tankyrase-1-like isoform X5 n=1 Tax=Schistocerca gregaria TaxID=7010 RepID=UPI00211DDADD|nr:poly [ADP-ribose] polymerase tankyrase-1-like isoform X5 [Schistocerca gregaria]